ncbi:MAG: acetoacetate--CoA ligase, partial [Rhodospirillales bacterium]
YRTVSRLQQALRAAGVGPGDRVAGYLPNMPEAVMAMLAATSIGAVWSSASPDFGVRGVVDRFGQIDPKVLFCVDGYHYNGKSHDCLAKTAEIAAEIGAIGRVVVVPYVNDAPDVSGVRDAVTLGDFIAPFEDAEVSYQRMPFDHPLYILYSSGTTGAPKCIVHRAGGVLLQHLKEHALHCGTKPGERIFYFTTCGWMMWNWLVTALACEATLLLYDGSPFYPDGNVLFDYAEQERMNLFGTSAKSIDAYAKGGLEPAKTHDLSTLRMMTSTGSPLAPEGFDYVYEKVKKDIHLASIAGGTDLVACFMLGSPLLPVWRGEIQCAGLGMETTVYDDQGNALLGEKGELVCTGPFPSMPIGFWNDPGDERYRAAYYERFPNIWHHGDFVEKTEHGGFIIYGRSDAVLNPGGVRIGTAEIYRQVEQLEEVLEGIVIGQDWDHDVRVVLFVRLAAGVTLDEALEKRIRGQIRANCTPRHVPAKIVPVADIPRTKSGKIVELAVRDVVHGRAVKNKEALANPDALELFRDLEALKS